MTLKSCLFIFSAVGHFFHPPTANKKPLAPPPTWLEEDLMRALHEGPETSVIARHLQELEVQSRQNAYDKNPGNN